MESNAISKIILVVGGLLLGLVVITNIMSSGGNTIANTWFYVSVGGFAFGIARPKLAFYLILTICGYLDLLKRLLLMAGSTSMTDLYWVLGFPMVTLLGICVGSLTPLVVGGKAPRPYTFLLVAITIVLFGMLGLAIFKTNGVSLGSVAQLGNAGAYLCLMFVVPILFPAVEDLRKLLKHSFVIFIPVMLYALYHGVYGLNDFEMDYLTSGLTIEMRQLTDIASVGYVRPHSTLNSAANLSSMMAVMAAATFIRLPKDNRGRFEWWRIPLAVLFGIAAYITASRGGWVGGGVALIGIIVFRSAFLTAASYAAAVASVALLILFADSSGTRDLLGTIERSLTQYADSALARRAAVMGTFNDRLISFSNLKNERDLWTPFGYSLAGKGEAREKYLIHDGITQALVDFGYVPLFIGAFTGIVLLFRSHRFMLGLGRGIEGRIAIFCMCGMAGIGSGLMHSAAQLKTYPLNFYFYMFLGVFISLWITKKEQKVEVKSRGLGSASQSNVQSEYDRQLAT